MVSLDAFILSEILLIVLVKSLHFLETLRCAFKATGKELPVSVPAPAVILVPTGTLAMCRADVAGVAKWLRATIGW